MDRSTMMVLGVIVVMFLFFAVVTRVGTQMYWDGMVDYHEDIVSGEIDHEEILANLERQMKESDERARKQQELEEARKQSPAGVMVGVAGAGLAMVVLLGLGVYVTIAGKAPEDEPLPPLPPMPPAGAQTVLPQDAPKSKPPESA